MRSPSLPWRTRVSERLSPAAAVTSSCGTAELAFTVVDEHQGQGIASALLRHLVTLARAAGLHELIAEVLPDNGAMLQVFERSGLELKRQRESGIVHLTLQLR